MKIFLSLLLLIPLNLYSELSEWENKTWKCLGQDILGTGELNGFAHCIKKPSNENFYWHFNDDGFIKDDIIFQIPEDKSFVIFSEYKDETNNGMQFGILKNSDIWFVKYLDGEKHGLEIAHRKSEGLTNIREYWEGQFSEATPMETKEIIDIDNDYVISRYNAYLADENGEFIPNTFYYESDTKLDRANNMQPLETTTHYAKRNSDMQFFGQGIYKLNGNPYYLNWDEIDESGQPTQITGDELEEDIILFSMQLTSLNIMKQDFGEENMIFQNKLKEKYGVNYENTFDEILNRLDEYISQNLVASSSNEIKLECLLDYYGVNNDQKINFYFTLKNDILYDDDTGSQFYLKEKNENFYIFAHKEDDLYMYRLDRKNLDMLMVYNSGKNTDELSCSTSAPLL